MRTRAAETNNALTADERRPDAVTPPAATLRFLAATLEEAVAKAELALGTKVVVVAANRVRRGGIAGFFTTEVGVEVEVVPAAGGTSTTFEEIVAGAAPDVVALRRSDTLEVRTRPLPDASWLLDDEPQYAPDVDDDGLLDDEPAAVAERPPARSERTSVAHTGAADVGVSTQGQDRDAAAVPRKNGIAATWRRRAQPSTSEVKAPEGDSASEGSWWSPPDEGSDGRRYAAVLDVIDRAASAGITLTTVEAEAIVERSGVRATHVPSGPRTTSAARGQRRGVVDAPSSAAVVNDTGFVGAEPSPAPPAPVEVFSLSADASGSPAQCHVQDEVEPVDVPQFDEPARGGVSRLATPASGPTASVGVAATGGPFRQDDEAADRARERLMAQVAAALADDGFLAPAFERATGNADDHSAPSREVSSAMIAAIAAAADVPAVRDVVTPSVTVCSDRAAERAERNDDGAGPDGEGVVDQAAVADNGGEQQRDCAPAGTPQDATDAAASLSPPELLDDRVDVPCDAADVTSQAPPTSPTVSAPQRGREQAVVFDPETEGRVADVLRGGALGARRRRRAELSELPAPVVAGDPDQLAEAAESVIAQLRTEGTRRISVRVSTSTAAGESVAEVQWEGS